MEDLGFWYLCRYFYTCREVIVILAITYFCTWPCTNTYLCKIVKKKCDQCFILQYRCIILTFVVTFLHLKLVQKNRRTLLQCSIFVVCQPDWNIDCNFKTYKLTGFVAGNSYHLLHSEDEKGKRRVVFYLTILIQHVKNQGAKKSREKKMCKAD